MSNDQLPTMICDNSSTTKSFFARALVLSVVTVGLLLLLILTTATVLSPEADKSGLKFSLSEGQSESIAAVRQELHYVIKDFQWQSFATEIERSASSEKPTMPAERMRVSRKLIEATPVLPQAPALATDVPPTETSSPVHARSLARTSNANVSRKVQVETQKINLAGSNLGDHADESASLHNDYSGPKTHPPKNN